MSKSERWLQSKALWIWFSACRQAPCPGSPLKALGVLFMFPLKGLNIRLHLTDSFVQLRTVLCAGNHDKALALRW